MSLDKVFWTILTVWNLCDAVYEVHHKQRLGWFTLHLVCFFFSACVLLGLTAWV